VSILARKSLRSSNAACCAGVFSDIAGGKGNGIGLHMLGVHECGRTNEHFFGSLWM
jgi:hypothetical protein